MIRLVLFAALVAVPIAEIAVFLAVGDVIGALPTIGLIVLTALIGTILLRRQGLAAFARLRTDLDEGRIPAEAIGQAITVAIAGALLLTPGFITDTIGFLLFVPAVRGALWRTILKNVKVHRFETVDPAAAGYRPPHDRGPRTIDLDAEDYATRGSEDPSSPWRGEPDR